MARRKFTLTTAILLATTFGLWVHAQQADTRPLASLLPPGAILFLEAKDLHSLLNQWNHSSQKPRWLRSDNYAVMSQSRLLQRLSEAQDEFVSVAGFPVGMNLLDQVAGRRSAISLYDVSYNLSFVYLTQLSEDRLDTTTIWRSRSGFQTREVAGIPFYLKQQTTDHGSRTVAFAAHNGWLVLATDESRLAETLILLSGQEARSLSVEPWFKQAQAEKPEPGDLHLVYNLAAWLQTPQFRTYWIHRNASELKSFSAGVSDLYQKPNSFEEQRVLLRATATPVVDQSALGAALRYAPAGSTLYRAWAHPGIDQLHASIQQVVFGERVAVQDFNAPAPVVAPEAGAVGSESDLEIQIDQPPFQRDQTDSVRPLSDAIQAMQPAALLHVQTTTLLQDRVFVYPSSGLVVICSKPDDKALQAALDSMRNRVVSNDLDPLIARIEGNAVILSRIPLTPQSARSDIAPNTTRVAVYNHLAGWPNYKKLFGVIDSRGPTNPESMRSSGPAFFSGNLRSLADALPSLGSISLTATDQGTTLHEVLEYQWAPPK